MWKKSLLGAFSVGVLVIAATSRSDSGTQNDQQWSRPSLPASAGDEPITGTPAVSRSGSETRRHDPFTLYDVGPPGTKGWSYNDLSPTEKAQADRVRDLGGAAATQSAYAHAARERAQRAAGAAAAHELGVDDLSATGVVP